MVVATDVTAEILWHSTELILIAGGGGGNTIDPDDEITWCTELEEFCCCRFENIFNGLVGWW